ncbi:hypothetical protein VNI00_012410 [Paramarasmius palmivorus]|uniref:Uncharacterized protein n=1 Tax=Paramarasmius palmivorus TaxID=297713 RepID=A0AAW0C4H5_9AGAR
MRNWTIDDSSPLISYEPKEAWDFNTPHDDEFAPQCVQSSGYVLLPTDSPSRYYGQSYTLTWTPNASASFSFKGTSVKIYGGNFGSYGAYSVTLDGKQQQRLRNIPPEHKYNITLFEADDLLQEEHTVILTNTDDTGKGLDIDSITWSCEVPSEGETPVHSFFPDTRKEFTWAPEGKWNTSPEQVTSFDNGTGHSTSYMGASVNFTFSVRVAVALYGTIGPSNSRKYTVYVDSDPYTSSGFSSAYSKIWASKQMLFYTDSLQPGPHSIVIYNGEHEGAVSSRQLQDQTQGDQSTGLLELDYAEVWSTDVSTTSITPSTPVTPTPTRTTNEGGGNRLESGAIAGIVIASIAFAILLIALWYLNRRNKVLWRLLNRGYMVQSQFDPHSQPSTPPGGRSPRPEMGSFSNLATGANNMANSNASGSASRLAVDTLLPHHYQSGPSTVEGTALPTALTSSTFAQPRIDGLYTPYAGFGRDRSSSKASSHGGSVQTASTSQVGNPYPDAAYPVRNAVPQRSGTVDTTSTLVAENGSQATSSDDNTSLLKRLSTRAGRRQNTPPTPTPTLATVTSSSGSQTTGRRRRARPYASRRSTSPSSARLLPNRDLPSDSDDEAYDYEDDAVFYASNTNVASYTPSSPRSLARTQSDIIQTPVRGRYDSVRTVSRPTTLPTPAEEDEQVQLAREAQLQFRLQEQLESNSEQAESGNRDGSHDAEEDDGLGTLVDVPPRWMTNTPSLMESPPPAYTSNRASLAFGSVAGSRNNSGS